MQNASLIAILSTTISPNDSLTEELNEDKAGSSDFVLIVFEVLPVQCVPCCSGVTFADVVQISLAANGFQVKPFKRAITFIYVIVSQNIFSVDLIVCTSVLLKTQKEVKYTNL